MSLKKAILSKQQFLYNNLVSFLDGVKSTLVSGPKTVNYFKTKIGRLEEIWSGLKKNHDHLYEFKDSDLKDDSYFVESHFEKAEEFYRGSRTFLLDEIEKLSGPPTQSPSRAPVVISEPLAPVTPSINVPKFSGLASDWESVSYTHLTLPTIYSV